MNILVTGALGFVGKNLIKKLIQLNHKVIGLDNFSIGTKDDMIDGIEYYKTDVQNISIVKEKIDICFHLAALSRIQPSFENPVKTFNSNTVGTQMVCEWARLNNVKVIYSGSSSQWHDPFQSPYAIYKKLGEDICKMYRKVYNTNIEIARFYNVYGQGEITEGKWAAVIGLWRDLIKNNKPITIVGDGEQRRDFTYIDDIVDGLIKIAFSSQSHDDAWELGTGFNYSLNEVANLFIEKFNCKKVYIPQQKGNYNQTIRVNNDAIDRLNWKPTDKLKEYILNLNE